MAVCGIDHDDVEAAVVVALVSGDEHGDVVDRDLGEVASIVAS